MAVCLEYQAVYTCRKRTSASIAFPLCAALLLLSALSARITLKIQTTKLGYQIAKERTRTVELDMQRRELELSRSVLLRPDTLGKEAKRLGLRALDIESDEKVIVLTSFLCSSVEKLKLLTFTS